MRTTFPWIALVLARSVAAQCPGWESGMFLAGASGPVRATAAFDDGSGPALFAGGTFQHAGGLPANRVARWNGVAWTPLGSGLGGTVRALAAYDDGTGLALYAGGDFAGGIARFDGTSWTAPGGGLFNGIPNQVLALAVFDDGLGPRSALYAGGQFRMGGGGFLLDNVARYDGGTWWSPNGGTRVRCARSRRTRSAA
jgi:hypothetical protein